MKTSTKTYEARRSTNTHHHEARKWRPVSIVPDMSMEVNGDVVSQLFHLFCSEVVTFLHSEEKALCLIAPDRMRVTIRWVFTGMDCGASVCGVRST
ncbi:hypothetical protein Q3G72_009768 [Acer saccharum]|nr:hypothetical protein Q3G72_009768 [Acer saccharum]